MGDEVNFLAKYGAYLKKKKVDPVPSMDPVLEPLGSLSAVSSNEEVVGDRASENVEPEDKYVLPASALDAELDVLPVSTLDGREVTNLSEVTQATEVKARTVSEDKEENSDLDKEIKVDERTLVSPMKRAPNYTIADNEAKEPAPTSVVVIHTPASEQKVCPDCGYLLSRPEPCPQCFAILPRTVEDFLVWASDDQKLRNLSEPRLRRLCKNLCLKHSGSFLELCLRLLVVVHIGKRDIKLLYASDSCVFEAEVALLQTLQVKCGLVDAKSVMKFLKNIRSRDFPWLPSQRTQTAHANKLMFAMCFQGEPQRGRVVVRTDHIDELEDEEVETICSNWDLVDQWLNMPEKRESLWKMSQGLCEFHKLEALFAKAAPLLNAARGHRKLSLDGAQMLCERIAALKEEPPPANPPFVYLERFLREMLDAEQKLQRGPKFAVHGVVQSILHKLRLSNARPSILQIPAENLVFYSRKIENSNNTFTNFLEVGVNLTYNYETKLSGTSAEGEAIEILTRGRDGVSFETIFNARVGTSKIKPTITVKTAQHGDFKVTFDTQVSDDDIEVIEHRVNSLNGKDLLWCSIATCFDRVNSVAYKRLFIIVEGVNTNSLLTHLKQMAKCHNQRSASVSGQIDMDLDVLEHVLEASRLDLSMVPADQERLESLAAMLKLKLSRPFLRMQSSTTGQVVLGKFPGLVFNAWKTVAATSPQPSAGDVLLKLVSHGVAAPSVQAITASVFYAVKSLAFSSAVPYDEFTIDEHNVDYVLQRLSISSTPYSLSLVCVEVRESLPSSDVDRLIRIFTSQGSSLRLVLLDNDSLRKHSESVDLRPFLRSQAARIPTTVDFSSPELLHHPLSALMQTPTVPSIASEERKRQVAELIRQNKDALQWRSLLHSKTSSAIVWTPDVSVIFAMWQIECEGTNPLLLSLRGPKFNSQLELLLEHKPRTLLQDVGDAMQDVIVPYSDLLSESQQTQIRKRALDHHLRVNFIASTITVHDQQLEDTKILRALPDWQYLSQKLNPDAKIVYRAMRLAFGSRVTVRDFSLLLPSDSAEFLSSLSTLSGITLPEAKEFYGTLLNLAHDGRRQISPRSDIERAAVVCFQRVVQNDSKLELDITFEQYQQIPYVQVLPQRLRVRDWLASLDVPLVGLENVLQGCEILSNSLLSFFSCYKSAPEPCYIETPRDVVLEPEQFAENQIIQQQEFNHVYLNGLHSFPQTSHVFCALLRLSQQPFKFLLNIQPRHLFTLLKSVELEEVPKVEFEGHSVLSILHHHFSDPVLIRILQRPNGREYCHEHLAVIRWYLAIGNCRDVKVGATDLQTLFELGLPLTNFKPIQDSVFQIVRNMDSDANQLVYQEQIRTSLYTVKDDSKISTGSAFIDFLLHNATVEQSQKPSPDQVKLLIQNQFVRTLQDLVYPPANKVETEEHLVDSPACEVWRKIGHVIQVGDADALASRTALFQTDFWKNFSQLSISSYALILSKLSRSSQVLIFAFLLNELQQPMKDLFLAIQKDMPETLFDEFCNCILEIPCLCSLRLALQAAALEDRGQFKCVRVGLILHAIGGNSLEGKALKEFQKLRIQCPVETIDQLRFILLKEYWGANTTHNDLMALAGNSPIISQRGFRTILDTLRFASPTKKLRKKHTYFEFSHSFRRRLKQWLSPTLKATPPWKLHALAWACHPITEPPVWPGTADEFLQIISDSAVCFYDNVVKYRSCADPLAIYLVWPYTLEVDLRNKYNAMFGLTLVPAEPFCLWHSQVGDIGGMVYIPLNKLPDSLLDEIEREVKEHMTPENCDPQILLQGVYDFRVESGADVNTVLKNLKCFRTIAAHIEVWEQNKGDDTTKILKEMNIIRNVAQWSVNVLCVLWAWFFALGVDRERLSRWLDTTHPLPTKYYELVENFIPGKGSLQINNAFALNPTWQDHSARKPFGTSQADRDYTARQLHLILQTTPIACELKGEQQVVGGDFMRCPTILGEVIARVIIPKVYASKVTRSPDESEEKVVCVYYTGLDPLLRALTSFASFINKLMWRGQEVDVERLMTAFVKGVASVWTSNFKPADVMNDYQQLLSFVLWLMVRMTMGTEKYFSVVYELFKANNWKMSGLHVLDFGGQMLSQFDDGPIMPPEHLRFRELMQEADASKLPQIPFDKNDGETLLEFGKNRVCYMTEGLKPLSLPNMTQFLQSNVCHPPQFAEPKTKTENGGRRRSVTSTTNNEQKQTRAFFREKRPVYATSANRPPTFTAVQPIGILSDLRVVDASELIQVKCESSYASVRVVPGSTLYLVQPPGHQVLTLTSNPNHSEVKAVFSSHLSCWDTLSRRSGIYLLAGGIIISKHEKNDFCLTLSPFSCRNSYQEDSFPFWELYACIDYFTETDNLKQFLRKIVTSMVNHLRRKPSFDSARVKWENDESGFIFWLSRTNHSDLNMLEWNRIGNLIATAIDGYLTDPGSDSFTTQVSKSEDLKFLATIPELDFAMNWFRTNPEWHLSAIMKRQFTHPLLGRDFILAASKLHNLFSSVLAPAKQPLSSRFVRSVGYHFKRPIARVELDTMTMGLQVAEVEGIPLFYCFANVTMSPKKGVAADVVDVKQEEGTITLNDWLVCVLQSKLPPIFVDWIWSLVQTSDQRVKLPKALTCSTSHKIIITGLQQALRAIPHTEEVADFLKLVAAPHPIAPLFSRAGHIFGVHVVDFLSTRYRTLLRLARTEKVNVATLTLTAGDLYRNDMKLWLKLESLFSAGAMVVYVRGRTSYTDRFIKQCCEFTAKSPWLVIILEGAQINFLYPEQLERLVVSTHGDSSDAAAQIRKFPLNTSGPVLDATLTRSFLPDLRNQVQKGLQRFLAPGAKASVVVFLVGPPGIGKTYELSRVAEEKCNGIDFVYQDGSSIQLLRYSLADIFFRRGLTVSAQQTRVLIMDEFHMMTPEQKRDLIALAALYEIHLLLIGNRYEHADVKLLGTDTIINCGGNEEDLVKRFCQNTEKNNDDDCSLEQFAKWWVCATRLIFGEDSLSYRFMGKIATVFSGVQSLSANNIENNTGMFADKLREKLKEKFGYLEDAFCKAFCNRILEFVFSLRSSLDTPQDVLALQSKQLRIDAVHILVYAALINANTNSKSYPEFVNDPNIFPQAENMHPARKMYYFVRYLFARRQIDISPNEVTYIARLSEFSLLEIPGRFPRLCVNMRATNPQVARVIYRDVDPDDLPAIKEYRQKGYSVDREKIKKRWKEHPVTDLRSLTELLNVNVWPDAVNLLSPENVCALLLREQEETLILAAAVTRAFRSQNPQPIAESPYFAAFWRLYVLLRGKPGQDEKFDPLDTRLRSVRELADLQVDSEYGRLFDDANLESLFLWASKFGHSMATVSERVDEMNHALRSDLNHVTNLMLPGLNSAPADKDTVNKVCQLWSGLFAHLAGVGEPMGLGEFKHNGGGEGLSWYAAYVLVFNGPLVVSWDLQIRALANLRDQILSRTTMEQLSPDVWRLVTDSRVPDEHKSLLMQNILSSRALDEDWQFTILTSQAVIPPELAKFGVRFSAGIHALASGSKDGGAVLTNIKLGHGMLFRTKVIQLLHQLYPNIDVSLENIPANSSLLHLECGPTRTPHVCPTCTFLEKLGSGKK